MRLSNNYIPNFPSIFIAVCFLFWAFGSVQAQTVDADKIWTTIGSAGMVDEADVSKVFFDFSKVQMGRTLGGSSPTVKKSTQKSAVIQQTQTAVIRYNVTPVDGLFTPVSRTCDPGANTARQLTLRYLATSGARVIAKLIEVDLAAGAETDRLVFDSRLFGTSDNYQRQSSNQCGANWRFDFESKAYYIEAKLITSGSIINTSAAGIQMIKIETVLLP